MKKIFLSAGLALLLAGCALIRDQNSAQESGGIFAGELLDGVYEGSAPGHRGTIHVRVHMEGGSIAQIDIIDSNEDQFVGGAAIEELLELALIYNTADLDAVSGATESSEGFLAALADALNRAR
jgi:uncharacterized protein with FMN-binding domain